ncbi:MAG TPA: helix-hairpin-helix domain-containing protein [Terriglobales bacterium]|nr:helix-hairpin-helix domain-containing protein [Terriglobales bacterium]
MRTTVVAFVLVSLLSFAACTSKERTPEQIRAQTANATQKIKTDTVAVAQGIKEGLSKPRVLDLNSASKAELSSLPGISLPKADKIIAARPYANADQLVTKRVLTQGEYEQIQDRVTVSK